MKKSSSTRCKRRRRPVRRLAAVVGLVYLGICVLTAWFQSRLIYFPTHGYESTPADLGLEFENLSLTTADGVSIAAWYVPRPDAAGSVIYCHGNAGNMAGRLPGVKLLHDMGVNVLIFDYRGFGRSSGKPSERGTYEDAEAAWRYLVATRGQSPNRVVLFGRSLGGAVAIELATRHEPAALVVESTFTNLLDIGRLHYPWLPVRWLLTYQYDSIEKIPHLTCPKLFFHGTEDSLVPIANGRRLFEAASQPKTFLATPGEHNESGFTYSTRYRDQLAKWLENVLSSS